MRSFKWLQFSDLHLNPNDSFDTLRAREELINCLKKEKFECNYLFITGDIADRNNYSSTKKDMHDLLSCIDIAPDNIFWAVGNHDIKRSSMRNDLIAKIREDKNPSVKYESMMSDVEYRSFITRASMDNYIREYDNLFRIKNNSRLTDSEIDDAHIYYDLEHLNLVVLNTCLTSCDDNDSHQLIITEPRLYQVFKRLKETNCNKPFFVIGHHGKDFFHYSEQKKLAMLFDNAGVDVYLCGHEHQLGYTRFDDAEREIHQIICGGGLKDTTSIFSFIYGEFNAEGCTVHITPYSYSCNGSNLWNKDYNLHRKIAEYNAFNLERFSQNREKKTNTMSESEKQEHNNEFPQIINFYKLKKENNFFQRILVKDNAPPSFEVGVSYEDESYKSLDILINEIIDKTFILYLLGDAGTGKTYSLVKLWSQLITQRDTIFIQLHMLDEQEDSIKNYLLTRVFETDENALSKFLKNYLKSNADNHFVLLLDGFNEIRKEKRNLVLRELDKLNQIYNLRTIISSRDIDNLSQSIIKSRKAKMQSVTEKQINDYLLCVQQFRKSTKKISPVEKTMQLLKNPLMLALYADTTEIFNEYDLDVNSYECIKFYPNVYSGSIIIWNYLQSEIIKSFSLPTLSPEDKFNSFVLVRYILPHITYQMQRKLQYSLDMVEITSYFESAIKFCNTTIRNIDMGILLELRNSLFLSLVKFDVINDVEKLIELAMKWLHLFVVDDTNILDLTIASKGSSLSDKTSKYKKKYRLFHQSVRDCLAAIYIIDCFRISGTDIDSFDTKITQYSGNPDEYNYIYCLAKDDFSVNPSLLNHIAELEQQENCDNISVVFEKIRGLRFPLHGEAYGFRNNMLVKNVLNVIGVINGFDFSNKFDLSNLDLRNVRLDKFALTTDKTGAILSQSLLGLETFELKGHDDIVWSVEISKDQKWLLSSSPNSIRLWELATKKCKAIINANERISLDFKRSDACFYYDNIHCAFISENIVYLYNVYNDKQTIFLECKSKIKYIKFSPNGRYFIVGEYNDEITVFSVKGLKLTKLITKTDTLTYHNDVSDNLTAFCGKDEIVIYNLESKKNEFTFDGFTKPVDVFIFSPSQKFCASSHGMRKQQSDIRILDLKNGKIVSINDAHMSSICDMCFTNDEKYLLTCSLDGFVKIWDVQKGTLFLYTGNYRKSLNSICAVPNLFDDNYFRFMCSDSSGIIHFDSLRNEENQQFTWYFNSQFNGHTPYVYDIAIRRDGAKIYAAYDDALIREWTVKTETVQRTYLGHKKSVTCIALSNTERVLASGSLDGTVRLWNLNNLDDTDLIIEFTDFPNAISKLIFDNKDEQLIVGLSNGNIYVIDLDTKERKKMDEIHKNTIREFLITRDNFLLSSSDDAKIIKWDLIYLCPLNEYKGHTGRIWSMALHPNKPSFISNSEDGFIIEWDIVNEQPKRKIQIPLTFKQYYSDNNRRSADSICYSKNGNTVLFTNSPQSVSIDMPCELVEMNIKDNSFRRYFCHTANITRCKYLDINKTISSSYDGFIRLCDLENLEVLKEFNAKRSFGEMVAHCELSDISFEPNWVIRNYK